MSRYYLGLDWGDKAHMVWVGTEAGEKVVHMKVEQTFEGMSQFGRWLNECEAAGIEIWAAIERPEGRIVDFLLDHGVVVYPINPKALDRARDRFRTSRAKSDEFDAWVLAEFVRTDHVHLSPVQPSSPQAQELKMLSRDYHRLVREQTRLINQLTDTLKEYYPRFLEVFEDLTSELALDFLEVCPTPEAMEGLTEKQWQQFAQAHRLRSKRTAELWERFHRPRLPMPAHVVRAKSRLVGMLVQQLRVTVTGVKAYRAEVQRFFACCPAAKLTKTLPGGHSGIIIPTIWAELGDAPGRWKSFRHLQAQAGTVPVTRQSQKSRSVCFRFACNRRLRYGAHWLAFISLRTSDWARAYYNAQRRRGHSHRRALRALASKWLKIIFVMWSTHVPYDENLHLANMARQHLRHIT
jgi:transposase